VALAQQQLHSQLLSRHFCFAPYQQDLPESHVAVIRLKELASGFRVLSAEAVRIDGLLEAQKNHLLGKVLNNQTKRPAILASDIHRNPLNLI
jgi:hypothetical protein